MAHRIYHHGMRPPLPVGFAAQPEAYRRRNVGKRRPGSDDAAA